MVDRKLFCITVATKSFILGGKLKVSENFRDNRNWTQYGHEIKQEGMGITKINRR